MKRFILTVGLSLAMTTVAAAEHTDQMVTVPAGVFIMGDGVAGCGQNEHEVTLTRDFHLGQHEVTNLEYLEAAQWAYDHGYVTATTASLQDNLDGSTEELLDLDNISCEIQFDGAGSFYLRESPSSYAQQAYPGGYDPSEHPVKVVTWFGAVRYCDWLSLQAGLPRAYEHNGDWACNGGDPYGAQGYRLATDAEWEYAAQWDDERIYPWGNAGPNCARANYWACVRWSSPVGSYPDAPEMLRLSDMAGNVTEWCNDWLVCNLGTDPQTNPVGPVSGSFRAVHGGSWLQDSSYLRSAYRNYYSPPNYRQHYWGFRVARTDPTGAAVGDNHDRSQLLLDVNQPNPFVAMTRITYTVPNATAGSTVLLAVYDATGRLVRTLAAEQQVGEHTVSWDGTDNAGDPVAAGAYFYRLTAGDRRETKRLLLVR